MYIFALFFRGYLWLCRLYI